MAPFHTCGRGTQGPRSHTESAGSPSEPSRGGWGAPAPGAAGVGRPARLQRHLHIPAEPEAKQEVAGRGCGSPTASQRAKTHRSLRAPVSAQLPNSGTLAKLLRAGGGGPPRSGPHHRGREGGAVCARTLRRPSRPEKAARRFCASERGARQPIYRGGGARRASGRVSGPARPAATPPLGGGAVVEPGSPAGEQRKCRGVGAGPAPRPLLLAELLPPGGRADAQSWGPRGGTGGTRRG